MGTKRNCFRTNNECVVEPTKKKQKTSSSTTSSQLSIGTRISVWWPNYKRYYRGTIKRNRTEDGYYFIAYDDGDKLWTDLSVLKYKVVIDDLDEPDDPSQIQLECRVRVYWDQDGQYHAGKVTRKHKTNPDWWYVEYDDGESIAWVDFHETAFRICKENSKNNNKKQARTESLITNKQKKIKKAATDDHNMKENMEEKEIDDNDDNENHPQLEIGDRLEIWWEDDKAYYAGCITKKRKRVKHYFIEYDDGDTEWLDLRKETYRLLTSSGIKNDKINSQQKARDKTFLCSKKNGTVKEKKNDKQKLEKGDGESNPSSTKTTRTPKAIEQIDPETGDVVAVFGSQSLAAKETGIYRRSIWNVLQQEAKWAGGYSWRYHVDDEASAQQRKPNRKAKRKSIDENSDDDSVCIGDDDNSESDSENSSHDVDDDATSSFDDDASDDSGDESAAEESASSPDKKQVEKPKRATRSQKRSRSSNLPATKNSRVPKAVEQIDPETGNVVAVFETQAVAARKTGIHRRSIWNVLQQEAKLAGGYSWRYHIDDEASTRPRKPNRKTEGTKTSPNDIIADDCDDDGSAVCNGDDDNSESGLESASHFDETSSFVDDLPDDTEAEISNEENVSSSANRNLDHKVKHTKITKSSPSTPTIDDCNDGGPTVCVGDDKTSASGLDSTSCDDSTLGSDDIEADSGCTLLKKSEDGEDYLTSSTHETDSIDVVDNNFGTGDTNPPDIVVDNEEMIGNAATKLSSRRSDDAENSQLCEENLFECPDLSLLKVGTDIAVWWKDDRKYYQAEIKQIKSQRKKQFYLEYKDDSFREWIDLRNERFRLSQAPRNVETDIELLASQNACSSCDKLQVGSRVNVWWPDDALYYSAVVLKIRKNQKRQFLLLYDDDGMEEWIDLRKERFHILTLASNQNCLKKDGIETAMISRRESSQQPICTPTTQNDVCQLDSLAVDESVTEQDLAVVPFENEDEATLDHLNRGGNCELPHKKVNAPRAVEQVDGQTGNIVAVFESQSSAAKETGIHIRSIWNALRQDSKLAGGYLWRFHGESGDLCKSRSNHSEDNVLSTITSDQRYEQPSSVSDCAQRQEGDCRKDVLINEKMTLNPELDYQKTNCNSGSILLNCGDNNQASMDPILLNSQSSITNGRTELNSILEQRLAMQMQLENILRVNHDVLRAFHTLEKHNLEGSLRELPQMPLPRPFLAEPLSAAQFSSINTVNNVPGSGDCLHGFQNSHRQSDLSSELRNATSSTLSNDTASAEQPVLLSPEEDRIINIVSIAAAALARKTK